MLYSHLTSNICIKLSSREKLSFQSQTFKNEIARSLPNALEGLWEDRNLVFASSRVQHLSVRTIMGALMMNILREYESVGC